MLSGGWARKLVSNFTVPKDRTIQNQLDYERLFTLCRLNQALAASVQATRLTTVQTPANVLVGTSAGQWSSGALQGAETIAAAEGFVVGRPPAARIPEAAGAAEDTSEVPTAAPEAAAWTRIGHGEVAERAAAGALTPTPAPVAGPAATTGAGLRNEAGRAAVGAERAVSATAAAVAALRIHAPVNTQRLLLEAKTTPFPKQRAIVDAYIRQQLVAIATAAHKALLQAGDPAIAAARLQAAAEAAARPKARAAYKQKGRSAANLTSSSSSSTGAAAPANQRPGEHSFAAVRAAGNSSTPASPSPSPSPSSSPSSPSSSSFPSSSSVDRTSQEGRHTSPPTNPSSSASVGGNSTGGGAGIVGRAELGHLVHQTLGFSVRVGPSTIPSAGLGLFLEGEAAPGTVVAVLPGLTYSCTQYKRMPHFPHIDRDNPYLSRRYDMDIVDSKPWGLGAQGGEVGGGWVTRTCPESFALGVLEGRHPLALGHYVNHPPPGVLPNVLEAAYDWAPAAGNAAWLRAYIPNCPVLDMDEGAADDEGEEEEDEDGEEEVTGAAGQEEEQRRLRRWARLFVGKGPAASTGGLVFVATRPISDGEELLQNYRLNPRGPRPVWYYPVDAQEDERRWAQLPLLNIFAPSRPKA